jgi:hypothetical protein
VLATALDSLVVLDRIAHHYFGGEAVFEYLARALGLFNGGGGVSVYDVAKLQNLPLESAIAQILVEVIYTVPKVPTDPGDIAAQRDCSDGRDLENAVRDDIVPVMLVRQHAKTYAAGGVFRLNADAIEWNRASVPVTANVGPRMFRSEYLNAFALAQEAEETLPALVPVRAEICNL